MFAILIHLIVHIISLFFHSAWYFWYFYHNDYYVSSCVPKPLTLFPPLLRITLTKKKWVSWTNIFIQHGMNLGKDEETTGLWKIEYEYCIWIVGNRYVGRKERMEQIEWINREKVTFERFMVEEDLMSLYHLPFFIPWMKKR